MVRDVTQSQLLSPTEALNDDFSSKVDDRINDRDKQLLDCPINDPDAILASTGRSWDDLVSAT